MRIIYMGTPEFAVPPLHALVDAGHEIAAVVTKPDMPQGRKMILTPPPVRIAAQALGLPIYQPATLKDEKMTELLCSFSPDVIVVAAYGKILPKAILELPVYGCINLHASLLPKFRGASPIQTAILSGEKITGVTAMQMAEGIDTGDILQSVSTPIGLEENAQELTARLSRLGAELIVKTLTLVQEGKINPKPQQDSESCYAPLITKKMSEINWDRTALEIHNQIRALYPWPAASTSAGHRKLKILRSCISNEKAEGGTGNVFPADGRFLVRCGGDTALELLEVQPEGGRRMSGRDFLRGHPADELQLS